MKSAWHKSTRRRPLEQTLKRELSRFRKDNLDDYAFPGADAAVCHVAEKLTQKELNAIFDTLTGPERRYYPAEDGWGVKFPWWAVSELIKDNTFKRLFKRQKKGWDHEHCSFCRADILVGQICHACPHEEGGLYLFCPECYGLVE